MQLRSFGRRARFAGPAVTVKCFEDNALLKTTLAEHPDPNGAVLVVDGGGSLRTALVGDLIAGIAVDRGWAGIVVHGCIRDSVAIDGLDDRDQGARHQPAQEQQDRRRRGRRRRSRSAALPSRPGQIVHSDEDGIVVLP